MSHWILVVAWTAGFWGGSAWAKDNDCVMCHEPLVSKTYLHGAVQNCLDCHAPHDEVTGQAFRLRQKPQALCLMCHDVFHQDSEMSGHSIGNDPEDSEQQTRDPIYPDKEFTCVSCHNPHSSNQPMLFRYKLVSGDAFGGSKCMMCHWEYYTGDPRPPAPPWNQKK